MPRPITPSALRILRPDGKTVGTGFLVTANLVVTCAHVAAAAGLDAEEKIPVQFSGQVEKLSAIVEWKYWRDIDKGDVAFLRLERAATGVEPLRLGLSAHSQPGSSFRSYGYATAADVQGLYANGIIDGYLPQHRLIQLQSPQANHGISGGPVFDEKRGVVVGMITKGHTELGRNENTTFAIPCELLFEVCPEIHPSEACPYLGLKTFTADTSQFFFGRERLTEKLVAALRGGCRFLAVIGQSGSGKSSVVQAGLLPKFKEGSFAEWQQFTIRPADDPFAQFKLSGLDLLTSLPERVILFVDQFEELFTLCPDALRERFIGELAAVLDRPRFILVISMRNDFYSAFHAKAALLAESEHLKIESVPDSLKREELLAIIERPARLTGLTLEEGLPELILKDLTQDGEARSSTLPLLEFALTQLWHNRQDGQLTHSAYQSIGGVIGSLARWAEEAYCGLPKDEQLIAENLLTSLIHLGDETQGMPDTRKRRSLSNFDEKGLRSIKHFVDRRLLITTGDTVELVHDALVREWGRLQEWIKKNREQLRILEAVSEAAQTWSVAPHNTDMLVHRGGRLEDALKLQDKLNAQEKAYLSTCKATQQKRKLNTIASITLAVLILVGVLAGWAWSSSQNAIRLGYQVATAEAAQSSAVAAANARATAQADAEKQTHIALARLLAAQSEQIIINDFELGLLLAVQANKIADLPETRFSLGKALEYEPTIDKVVSLENIDPKKVIAQRLRISADGKRIIASINYSDENSMDLGCSNTDIFIFDSISGDILSRDTLNFAATLEDVNQMGNIVGLIVKECGKAENQIALWDTSLHKISMRINHQANDLFFLKDGNTLVSAGDDTKIIFWNVKSGQPTRTFIGSDDRVLTILADKGEKKLFSGSYNGKLLIWDIETGQLLGKPIFVNESPQLSLRESVNSIVISNDNKYLVATTINPYGDIGQLNIWDLQSGANIRKEIAAMVLVNSDYSDTVVSYAWPTNDLKLWNIATNETILQIKGYSPGVFPLFGNSLAINQNGKKVYGLELNRLLIWDIEKKSQTGFPLLKFHSIPVIATSSDGKTLAVSGDNKIVIYDLATGVINRIIQTTNNNTNIYRLAFWPNHRVLGEIEHPSKLKFWNVDTGDSIKLLDANIEADEFVFSPDGKYLAFIKIGDETVTIIDLSTNRKVNFKLDEKVDSVMQMAFSSDNNHLVLGGNSKKFYIWNIEKEQLKNVPISTFNVVSYPSTNPSTNEVAITNASYNRVDIYDIETAHITQSLRITDLGYPAQQVFSPDGKKLAVPTCPNIPQTSLCTDSITYIFDTRTAKPESKIPLRSINWAFSPDGKIMFSAGNDDVVFGWNYDIDLWQQLGCYLANRNLTDEEWDTYIGILWPRQDTCNTNDFTYKSYVENLPSILLNTSTGVSDINDLDVLGNSTKAPEPTPESGNWTSSSTLPKELSESFSAILQCRESANSDKKTNEFLALWAISITDPHVWVEAGKGNVIIKNGTGEIVNIYDIKSILGGPNDWIMSGATLYAGVMKNPYEGNTSLELEITDVTTKKVIHKEGDNNYTVSYLDLTLSGNPKYPRHTIKFKIKNNNEDLLMGAVLVVGVITNDKGEVVDILQQEDDGSYQLVSANQEKIFTVSSISKTGRCTGADTSNYVLHYWVSYFREDNQLMTKYFTKTLK